MTAGLYKLPEEVNSHPGINEASKMMETPDDRSILKVHLPNGGFNMVRYGDATDVKVGNRIV